MSKQPKRKPSISNGTHRRPNLEIHERFGDARTVYNQHGRESTVAVEDATGVPTSTISEIENGKRKPRADTIIKLARHYGVSSDFLLGLSDVATPNTTTQAVIAHTGLTENNVDFLNICTKFMYLKPTASPENIAYPLDPSFVRWAKESGILNKTKQLLDNLPEFDNYNMEGGFKLGETTQSESDAQMQKAFGIMFLLFVNTIIEVAKDSPQMIADFASLTPVMRLGVGYLAFMDNTQTSDTGNLNINSQWNTINLGKELINHSDYIRFKACEIGRAIEHHLLEKFGYGND